MNRTFWRDIKPHTLAVGIFALISALYCLPVFQGMVTNAYDVAQWKAMAQQSFEFNAEFGYFPLWTNSLFSGMPTFQIMAESQYNITIAHLHRLFTLFMPTPAGLFFLACICFYILSCTMKLKSWPGIFGSLAYAFSTYNAILVATGHTTKFSSMGYAPAVLAGLILLTQRKYVLGFATTFLFGTLLFYQNHIQIVYYTLLIALLLMIAFAVHSIKLKETFHLFKVTGLAALAGLIAFGSYTVTLLPTYDYAKETMRGGRSELTVATDAGATKANKSKNGLDRDYAFRWSYGIAETSTLLVPNAYGGGNNEPLPESSKAVEALQESGFPQETLNFMSRYLSPYWGDQPSTEGPVYFGAIVCLLFVAGLFFIKDWHLGWILTATILGIVLSWGKNLPGFNNFLFDYLPFYNKFRAPSMSLVIPQLTVCLLAAMTLQSIMYGNWEKKELLKRMKYSGIAAVVMLAILGMIYVNGDFKGGYDNYLQQSVDQLSEGLKQSNPNNPQLDQQLASIRSSVSTGLKNDRQDMFGSDFSRSLVFILLAACLIFFGAIKKVKPLYASIVITLLTLVDLLGVDTRYLNREDYVTEDELMTPFAATSADLQIKMDTGYYRVFDEVSPETARASYHHNSITGYHPAKLSLYDDLLTNQIYKGNAAVLNMLNTKYTIKQNPQNRQPVVQLNPGALGPVWFVNTIKYVNNADEEMQALNTFNPEDMVIIDKREQKKVSFPPQPDSSASIELTFNRNDFIQYRSNASTNQFAVFSEVYYPRGWKAYIDDKEAEIVKVNYVLRGLPIPPGKHKIDFKFEPESFLIGDKISLAIGIISLLLIGFAAWYEVKQYKKNRQ